MSFSVRAFRGITEGDTSYEAATTHTCATVAKLEETVAASTTDQEHLIGIDISALKAFYMVADVDMTVDTNDSSTPDDTFSLVADQPVMFEEGGTNPLSADVTKIFVTNSGSTAGTLKIIAGQDV